MLLFALRLFGKREVGQFTLFDLVLILLVANAVQPAMTGPDSSLLGGFIIIVTLVVLNFAVGWLRGNVPWFKQLVQPKATVVARDGQWLEDELRREGIDDDEAMAALREHGLETVGETKMVVLEADGSLSVVPKDLSRLARRRRQVRFIHHP